jgi:amino-acid N-acetyltransferase
MTTARPAIAPATVRTARHSDAPALYELIRHYSDQGILLPRSLEDLRKNIGNFRIIRSNDRVLACATLRQYTPEAGELRSLAVAPEAHGTGLGRRMVEAVLAEARRRRFRMVFAFTYAVEFFTRVGFEPIDRSMVPWKAWNDCLACPKRDCCDETAVAYWLGPRPAPSASAVFSILPHHNT